MNVLRLPPISRQQKKFSRRFDYSVGNSSWSIEYRQKFRYLPPLRKKTSLLSLTTNNEPTVQYNRAHEAADAHWNLTPKEIDKQNNRKIIYHLRQSLNKRMQKRQHDLDDQCGSAGIAELSCVEKCINNLNIV
ncbi:hypothetical protein KUTeg_023510 [Tegillarca granosa]|uniref:Uncharacterized protein n=1 Tax=Tegillarca granosa TaxID=220873 RepID=A0ABQ9E2U5_TEGGR|nr:hypothetical protein KUTeg_023510 [Tegillarca granosa]